MIWRLFLLTLSDIASRGMLASALGLAILFYGGTTQALQLGVVAMLLVGVVMRFDWSLRHRKIYWSTAHTLLALYALLIVVNIYTSVFAENSLQVAWLFLVLPMTVLLCGRTNDDYWKALLPLLCLPMCFSVFWGFSEVVLGAGRASGPVIDPNNWASGINLFFFVLASWFFKSGGRTASILLILLGLFAAASFMAYSRVGSLVFGATFTLVSLVALSLSAYRRRAVMLLLVIATAYYSVHNYRSLEEATQHSEGYSLDIKSSGWSQRLAQWQSGLAQYRDHPIAGSGLGTFKVLYPQYRTLADAGTAGNYVHNDYIQLLAEGGPLMLLFVVLLGTFLFWQLSTAVWRLFGPLGSRPEPSRDRQLEKRKDFELVLLIMGLGTVFVHATMNFTFYSLVNPLIMGCVLARVLWLTGHSPQRALNLHAPGLLRVCLFIGVGYILLVNTADAVSRDLVYGSVVLPLDRFDPKDQLAIYETLSVVQKLRRNNSANRFAMATFYRTSFDAQPENNMEGRRSLAIVTALEYQRGLELNPYSYEVQRFFAEFLEQNRWLMEVEGVYQTPENLLRDGLARAPFQIHRHLVLAEYLDRYDRQNEAYEQLKSALVWSPMRYDGFDVWRTDLFVKLLGMAKSRQDQATLQELLTAIEVG
ncbi:MAG: O-antigen ligase [Candidatus Azotimanducaceae bacterium]|jgi:O-antigen ligase